MGNAALKELLKSERSTEHDIVILDLPSERSRKRLKPFENTAGLEIVWGDLTNYNDVLKCVSGADYVLHNREYLEGYQIPTRAKCSQAGHNWHGCCYWRPVATYPRRQDRRPSQTQHL